MTFGAHEIPILLQRGPLESIFVAYVFVRIEMKPALPALVLRPRIPGNRQHLDAPVGKLDHILLQGIETERVFDLKRCELAVRPVGLDKKLSILAKKA